MSYYFFMDKTLLPVAPSKLQTKIDNKNKTVNLINDGEVNILKNAGLTEVTFDVMLPNVKYPFANYFPFFQKADYFLDTFKKMKTSIVPFQFIVCRITSGYGLLFDTNLKVSLEDYAIIEDANNALDVMVSIKLKQYKPYATKTLTVKTNEDGSQTATVKQARESTKKLPTAYKVMAGQTLWEICKGKLGDGSKWQEIAKLNNIINPNSLDIGKVIKFG